MQVNGQSVVKASHSEVVKLIKSSGSELKLTVVRQRELASPQQSPSSSPDIGVRPTNRSVLHKHLSQAALQASSGSAVSIHATPPRQRSMSVTGQCMLLE